MLEVYLLQYKTTMACNLGSSWIIVIRSSGKPLLSKLVNGRVAKETSLHVYKKRCKNARPSLHLALGVHVQCRNATSAFITDIAWIGSDPTERGHVIKVVPLNSRTARPSRCKRNRCRCCEDPDPMEMTPWWWRILLVNCGETSMRYSTCILTVLIWL